MRLLTLLKQRRISYEHLGTAEITLACPRCARLGHRTDNSRLFYNVKKRLGHCWRCGWGGKEHDFLALLKLDTLQVSDVPTPDTPRPRLQRLSPLPAEVIPAYKHKRARHYLESRQVSLQEMKKFALLYCPDGYFQDRIIIPVCDRKGNYRTFVSRAIESTAEKKYLFPKGSTVSRLLYNLHFVTRRSVWLTEGVFDAIHCFPYAVATFGKHISDYQMLLLRLHHIDTVYLLWDHDAWQATPELWQRAVARLRAYFFTYQVKLPADTPTEYDVDSLKALCRKSRHSTL